MNSPILSAWSRSGLISYYDATNFDLKVAHLSCRLGTPWVREW